MQPKRAIGKQVQYADRKGAAVVAFLGPDEFAQGVVGLKRLRDGYEVRAPRADVARAVKDLLEKSG